MFDQVVVPDSLTPGGIHQCTHRLKLVIPRKDHRLLLHLPTSFTALFLDLEVNEPGKQVEQTVALQDFFPKIGGPVSPPLLVRRIPRSAIVTPVEGKKIRGLARQSRRHKYCIGIHCKMHQCPPFELENHLSRVPVLLVLPLSIFHILTRQRILEFRGDDGYAVQADRNVEGLFRARREMELSCYADAIRSVAGFQLRVQLMGRLEKSHPQGPAVAFKSVPKRGQRTVGIHPLAQVRQHLLTRIRAV